MSRSYYGRPVVKAHVWKWYVPAYFWVGGMAGAAAVQCACARLRGEDDLATVEQRAALAGVLVAPMLLIADLGVPHRFLHMLRVFKVTSPMSVGSWILSAFGVAIGGATAAELLGWNRTSRAFEFAAAGIGPALTVYTAVLVSDTATPVWHEAYETLPFVFVSSGIAAAGAVGTVFAPGHEQISARRLMIGGALALVVSGQIMERRLGTFISEPYRSGKAGLLRRVAGALALGGAGLALARGTSTFATRLAAACISAAGIIERFAVTTAGTQSASDPKYVVEPQRARLDARASAPPPT
ncbi:MAG: polysulfide reductase NrfD [Candidatus Eremiobacteraeota bacterium]|nr:polysulfide reductase NrfD [Candidatus Eremiobacteraeota bacterium]